MTKTEWVKSSLNLHRNEDARKKTLMTQGYSVRVLLLMGMDRAEEQLAGGGDGLHADVPDRALQAMIRSAVQSEVRAALAEPEPERPGLLASARVRAAALIAESRERGFGPDTPQAEKTAEAARLAAQDVSSTRIGELFGVSRQRVDQWLKRAAEVPAGGSEGDKRLRAARNRAGVPAVAFLDSAAGAP